MLGRLARLLAALLIILGSLTPSVASASDLDRLIELPSGSAPSALAIGPDDLIYVADSSGQRNGTIYVYSPTGVLVGRISIPPGPTGLVGLRGLAFDRQGNLYVADWGNGRAERGRILKVTARGQQSEFASGLTAPTGLVFDRSGILYVSDSLNGAVIWIGPDRTMAPYVEDGRLAGDPDRGLGATGLALAPDESALYVSNPADDRIYRLSISQDGSAGRLSVFAEGRARNGSRSGMLDGPTGLAVDESGNLYVASSRSEEIALFSSDGRWLGRVTTTGRAPVAPVSPALHGRFVYVVLLGADSDLSYVARAPRSSFAAE